MAEPDFVRLLRIVEAKNALCYGPVLPLTETLGSAGVAIPTRALRVGPSSFFHSASSFSLLFSFTILSLAIKLIAVACLLLVPARSLPGRNTLCIFTCLRKLKRRLQFSITVLGLLDSPCTIMLLTPWGFLSPTQSNYRVGSLDPVLEFGLVTKVESTTAKKIGYESPFF